MRISDWSSDVCSSDLPSAQVTVRRPGLPSSGFLYFVLAMPLPEQVGKPPPNASCRQSFVLGGTQAPYCVGPPGLERHRTTSQAQVLRSEEHTSELQSLMRISYVVFCLNKIKEDSDTA